MFLRKHRQLIRWPQQVLMPARVHHNWRRPSWPCSSSLLPQQPCRRPGCGCQPEWRTAALPGPDAQYPQTPPVTAERRQVLSSRARGWQSAQKVAADVQKLQCLHRVGWQRSRQVSQAVVPHAEQREPCENCRGGRLVKSTVPKALQHYDLRVTPGYDVAYWCVTWEQHMQAACYCIPCQDNHICRPSVQCLPGLAVYAGAAAQQPFRLATGLAPQSQQSATASNEPANGFPQSSRVDSTIPHTLLLPPLSAMMLAWTLTVDDA